MGLCQGSEKPGCSKFPRIDHYHGLTERTAQAADAGARMLNILGTMTLDCWALDEEPRTRDRDFFKLCPKQDMISLDQPAPYVENFLKYDLYSYFSSQDLLT